MNVNKLSGSSPKCTIRGYIYSRAVDTTYRVFQHTIDSAVENTVILQKNIGLVLNPTDVLYWAADTDTNSTIVNLRFGLNQYQRT